MRMRYFAFAGLIFAVAVVVGGCLSVRFEEPEGAMVTFQDGCFWSEPMDTPFPVEMSKSIGYNSTKNIKIILEDGFTIYGTLEVKEPKHTDFSKYGVVPIRLSEEEVIQPIRDEEKVVTYVVYAPWPGGIAPPTEKYPGLVGYVCGAGVLVGTVVFGEPEAEEKETVVSNPSPEESSSAPLMSLTSFSSRATGGGEAGMFMGGEDPVEAAKQMGEVLVVLRLGNRKF